VALLLTVIYLLINLSSLAPLALSSATVAHAATGECAVDCDICGCSAEGRANHTCCCCLKKKRHKMTMPTCNCPCGSNNHPGLPGAEKSEQLPYHFVEGKMLFMKIR
jgi:hypothetical protein